MKAAIQSKPIEQYTYRDAVRSVEYKRWKEAMKREIDPLSKNDAWKLVPRPKDVQTVDFRWVYRIKGSGLFKARFVARGFTQIYGQDYEETFAPVAKYTSIRILISIVAGHGNMKIHQMDVDTTFLNNFLKEKVYIEQPEGFVVAGKEDMVCLLNKALYGLKQSSREWFQVIAPTLKEFEFKQCDGDPCIFVLTRKRKRKRKWQNICSFVCRRLVDCWRG
jgi:hypothetical protein